MTVDDQQLLDKLPPHPFQSNVWADLQTAEKSTLFWHFLYSTSSAGLCSVYECFGGFPTLPTLFWLGRGRLRLRMVHALNRFRSMSLSLIVAASICPDESADHRTALLCSLTWTMVVAKSTFGLNCGFWPSCMLTTILSRIISSRHICNVQPACAWQEQGFLESKHVVYTAFSSLLLAYSFCSSTGHLLSLFTPLNSSN